MKREDSEAVRTVLEVNVEEWKKEVVECDMRTVGVCVDNSKDQVKRRLRINVADTK